jgi:hypothetical protein
VSGSGTRAAAAATHQVVVAKGTRTVTAAGKVKVKVTLTAAGGKLLKHAKKVKVVIKGTFAPTSGRSATRSKTVTLHR